MKVNPSENHETIYFIQELNEGQEIPVHVAFNNKLAAKAYINRFCTLGDAQIVECRLNPGFYTDITRDCYFIQLDRFTDVYVISLVNDLQRSELAINRHYFFEDNQIYVYAIAASENEALKEARKIKDKVSGHWGPDIQLVN
jgi:hypothetical protein